jgi:hypothetical protein
LKTLKHFLWTRRLLCRCLQNRLFLAFLTRTAIRM